MRPYIYARFKDAFILTEVKTSYTYVKRNEY